MGTGKLGGVMTRTMLSRIIGCGVALGVTLALASCTTPPDDPSATSPSPTATSTATDLPNVPTPTVSQPTASTTLDGVEVTGELGSEPELTVPSPWAINSTTTKIIDQGTGQTVPDAGFIQVKYVGVNGRTGEVFDNSWTNGVPVSFLLEQVVPGFQKGLSGQKVGSRILLAVPGADGYDARGGQQDVGIEIGDTLVFVVDIIRTEVTGPIGTTVTPTDTSLPTVTGPTDAPVITIAKNSTPPTELVVQPLIQGSGPAVETIDSVRVNYAEYLWSTGAMVRQSYGFTPLLGALSETIPGWQQALVGQTIGTRLLVIVPPELAYPEGHPKIGVPKGSTMVFVIDILYAASS